MKDKVIYPIVEIRKFVLINIFFNLFSDGPKLTYLVEHGLDIGDATPINQASYRMNHVKQEIDYLLENNII